MYVHLKLTNATIIKIACFNLQWTVNIYIRPYFWHEIRLSTHREHFGESRHPSEDI